MKQGIRDLFTQLFKITIENYLSRQDADVSISDIAVMLNMGRASLYRALDKLSAEGIISKDGRRIKIINKSKLKKIYISN